MDTIETNPREAVPPPAAGSAAPEREGEAPRFYWKQCYELHGVHWALCDTQTDADGPPRRVTCIEMVLLANYPNSMDGRPVGEQPIPALIVELLNKHFAAKVPQIGRAERAEGRPQ